MKNTLFKKQAGDLGETIAVDYLIKHGFTILERNFRIRGGEIDIIAKETEKTGEDVLVFIEVKTRRSGAFGTPLESITPWKLRSLIKTAQFYRLKRKQLPEQMRIDAIAIMLDSENKPCKIELVKNIS